jgi:hypothetical protein
MNQPAPPSLGAAALLFTEAAKHLPAPGTDTGAPP